MGRSSRNRPRSASSFESNRHFNIESIRLDPDRRSFLNLVLYVKPAFHTYLRTKSKVGCIFRKKASSQVKFTAAMSAPPLIGKAFPSDSGCRRQSSCPNSECQRRIFCEQQPEVVDRYAHRADRLNEAFSSIGF